MDRQKALTKILSDRFPGLSEQVQVSLLSVHREFGRGGPIARPDIVIKLWEYSEELFSPNIDEIVARFGSDEDGYTEVEGLPKGRTLWSAQLHAVRRMLAASMKERHRLNSMSAEEFQDFYRSHTKEYAQSTAATGTELDSERFFSFPEADADVVYWANISHWTLEEAVALSFGKEPTVVSSTTLALDKIEGPSSIKPEFARRRLAMQRALEISGLSEPVEAVFFLKWFSKNGISVLLDLDKIESDKERFDQHAAKEIQILKSRLASYEDDLETINAKSKYSLYKMFLIMATKRFAHSFSGNTPASKAIAHAYEQDNTLRMDVGTVRDWLTRIAADPSMEGVVGALLKTKRSP